MRFHITPLDILGSKTKAKIAGFLLDHKASMSEREIASVLKISHMSVNRIMRELAGINLVDFVAVGKAHLWKVNRKSYAYRLLLQMIKGTSSAKPVMDDLRGTILNGLPKAIIEKVILFGSVAKGLEKIDSDIDIFIMVKSKEHKRKLELLLERLSGICLERYGNRLAPYVLTEKEMKDKKNLKIISEINGGIQLYPQKEKLGHDN